MSATSCPSKLTLNEQVLNGIINPRQDATQEALSAYSQRLSKVRDTEVAPKNAPIPHNVAGALGAAG